MCNYALNQITSLRSESTFRYLSCTWEGCTCSGLAERDSPLLTYSCELNTGSWGSDVWRSKDGRSQHSGGNCTVWVCVYHSKLITVIWKRDMFRNESGCREVCKPWTSSPIPLLFSKPSRLIGCLFCFVFSHDKNETHTTVLCKYCWHPPSPSRQTVGRLMKEREFMKSGLGKWDRNCLHQWKLHMFLQEESLEGL